MFHNVSVAVFWKILLLKMTQKFRFPNNSQDKWLPLNQNEDKTQRPNVDTAQSTKSTTRQWNGQHHKRFRSLHYTRFALYTAQTECF